MAIHTFVFKSCSNEWKFAFLLLACVMLDVHSSSIYSVHSKGRKYEIDKLYKSDTDVT